MTVVSPSQSNAGDTIEAADVNTPVNQLAATINGNLDNTNLADSGVTTAKLADAAVTPAKLVAGTGASWSYTDYSATATVVGWSSTTTKKIYYKQEGKTVTMFYNISGTSNSALTTISLPVAPSTHMDYYENQQGLTIDNGSVKSPCGRSSIDNISTVPATVLLLMSDQGGSNFTATGTKTVRGMIVYEAA